MGEVDPAFIPSMDHRLKPTDIIEAEGIPTIDLSSIISLEHLSSAHLSNDEISGLITEIGDACEKWGFFQVTNHGVPMEKLEKIEEAAREFFDLPMEEKRIVKREEDNPMGYYDTEYTKNVRDWKEVYDFAAKDPYLFPVSPESLEAKPTVSRWPENPPDFREVALEYAKEMEKLSFKLVELIALSLGLHADRFNGLFDDSMSFIRLNRYPSCPSPSLALGVGPHKDAGVITILAQDSVGGLQVKRKTDGEWVNVKPTPVTFIINIGDIVKVWSNDKYESVDHRVMVNSAYDRVSIPFFFNPAHHVTIKPLEEFVDEKNNAKYKEYNWGAFFTRRRWGSYKKHEVENIQISQFKLT